MKKFWKKTEGFTLVELIVVIVILGILAGVGTVGYSGYVKKANMAADEALIRDIENSLILAGYGGTFADGENGYVILSASESYTSEQAGVGTNLDKALKAAFGDNYALKLKYGNWAGNGSMLSWLIGSNAEGTANNTYDEIVNVANSSFLTGNTTDELLNNVENLTTKLAGIVEVMDQSGKQAVYNMFKTTDAAGNETNAFQTVMTQYGYTDLDNVDSTTLSNMVVMAAAEEMKTMDSAAQMGGAAPSPMSTFVTYYSLYTAYAANENSSQAYKDKYEQLQQDIQNESNPANIMLMLQNFQTNITGNGADIPADSGWAEYSGGNNPIGSSYFNDVDAFASIMDAVDNAKVGSDDFKDANLFTQGTANSLFGSYVSAVNMVNGMSEEEYNAFVAAQSGGLSVAYSYVGNKISVVSSLPELG